MVICTGAPLSFLCADGDDAPRERAAPPSRCRLNALRGLHLGMRVGERGPCGSRAQLALQPLAQGAASTWF